MLAAHFLQLLQGENVNKIRCPFGWFLLFHYRLKTWECVLGERKRRREVDVCLPWSYKSSMSAQHLQFRTFAGDVSHNPLQLCQTFFSHFVYLYQSTGKRRLCPIPESVKGREDTAIRFSLTLIWIDIPRQRINLWIMSYYNSKGVHSLVWFNSLIKLKCFFGLN